MNCDPANPIGSGIVDVWQETVPVRFGSIDKSDRLTLGAILNYFQEAAISHAENLGVGREAMAKTGQGWILSRISVLVNARPKYGDMITVRSWPRGWEKLFAIRHYDIKDKNGTAVSARSAWIIVDIEKHRPLRPQPIMDNLPSNEGLEALTSEANGAAGLPERGNLQKKAERKALYNDVDYNGHVNNVSYIKWIEDVLDPVMLEKAVKMRFDINYLNEILGGETIEIFSGLIENIACNDIAGDDTSGATHAFAFEGRKTETGQSGAPTGCAFRAELRLWAE